MYARLGALSSHLDIVFFFIGVKILENFGGYVRMKYPLSVCCHRILLYRFEINGFVLKVPTFKDTHFLMIYK